jgi:outer membrane protein OmpA-like peptidoglycan-associated protein
MMRSQAAALAVFGAALLPGLDARALSPSRCPGGYSVFFDENSTVLSDRSLATIRAFLMDCQAQEGWTIRLDGHSDSKGDPEAQRAVSRARAEAVKRYMVTTGVRAEAIDVQALGNSQPIRDSVGGEAADRRVTLWRTTKR